MGLVLQRVSKILAGIISNAFAHQDVDNHTFKIAGGGFGIA
jgi:hypothetical protein